VIVIVFGLPGSGKSYFAQRLADMLNAEYVNSDRLRKELFSIRTYSASEKAQVYKAMLNNMNKGIVQGRDLVLDATFHKNESREMFAEKAGKEDLMFMEVQADEQIIRERLKKSRPYSEADYNVYLQTKEQWDPMSAPHLVLQSTNNNIDVMLQGAAKYLKDGKTRNRGLSF